MNDPVDGSAKVPLVSQPLDGTPPDAAQKLAFVDDQETLKGCPWITEAGLIDSVSVGSGGGNTVRVCGVDVTLVVVSGIAQVTETAYVPGAGGLSTTDPCA